MAEEMTLSKALQIIRVKNVPDRFYTLNGLGNGECIGISQDGNLWSTYLSERGAKWDIHEYTQESTACIDFLSRLQALINQYGYKGVITYPV